MYPHFIEVNDYRDERLVSINVDTITNFFANEEGGTDIELTTCQFCHAKESYSELKTLIEGCGCSINKGDPRLDTSRPLTMDDIKEMVGQPVWNSNIGEWGLITKDPEWHDETHPDWKRQSGYYLRYHNDTITRFDEEGLKKYPIYRMKQ